MKFRDPPLGPLLRTGLRATTTRPSIIITSTIATIKKSIFVTITIVITVIIIAITNTIPIFLIISTTQ